MALKENEHVTSCAFLIKGKSLGISHIPEQTLFEEPFILEKRSSTSPVEVSYF